MSIRGAVTGGAAAAKRLDDAAPRLRQMLERTIGRLTLMLLRRVKLKLSDEVLHVRSGRLRRSVNFRLEGRGTPRPVGFVGTNVSYGKVHEYGGEVDVKASLRLVKQAWGRPLKHPVWANVRAHKAVYPERSFLRSALREMEPQIRADLRNAVSEAVK